MLVWVIKKEDPDMKGKRYTTEEKIWALRARIVEYPDRFYDWSSIFKPQFEN